MNARWSRRVRQHSYDRRIGRGDRLEGRSIDNDLRSDRFPIQIGRILLGEDFDLSVANTDGVFTRMYLFFKIAKNRVIFQQMRQRLRIREIVDRNKFNIRIVERRPDYVSSNTSEPIDTDFNCH